MPGEQVVKLRPLNIDDSMDLVALLNNKKVLDNLRDFIPFPYSEEDALDFIKLIKNESPPMTFAIEACLPEGSYQGNFCGVISLVRQPDVYRLTAEIGYWIGEPYWNHGITSKAVELITRYGFNELNLIRIYAGIFEYNKASMRVLEKCGYEKDGVFKKSVIKNGLIWDEHRYSKVKNN